MNLFNKKSTLLLPLFMAFSINAMSVKSQSPKAGAFAGLIGQLRTLKKDVFKDVRKYPKQLFEDMYDQLRGGEQYERKLVVQYPSQIKRIYNSHWSLPSFFHVFIGEYTSKKQADLRNKYLVLLLKNKNISQQSLSNIYDEINKIKRLSNQEIELLKKRGLYCKKGIMKGVHTLDAFNSLKNSMELQDDFNIDGCVVDLEKEHYVSGTCYGDSYALTPKGVQVPGIKTVWPSAWAIADVLEVTKQAIDQVKYNLSSQPCNITGQAKKHGISLLFNVYVALQNGKPCVHTAFTQPDPIKLAKLAFNKKKTNNSSSKMLDPSERSVVKDDVLFALCGIDREYSITKIKKAIKAMQNKLKTLFCQQCINGCPHPNYKKLSMCLDCFKKKVKSIEQCCELFRKDFGGKLNLLLNLFDDQDKHDAYKDFVQSLNDTSLINSNIGINLSGLSLTSNSSTKLSNNNTNP